MSYWRPSMLPAEFGCLQKPACIELIEAEIHARVAGSGRSCCRDTPAHDEWKASERSGSERPAEDCQGQQDKKGSEANGAEDAAGAEQSETGFGIATECDDHE